MEIRGQPRIHPKCISLFTAPNYSLYYPLAYPGGDSLL